MKKKGFTLAEVLITLAVIGVIAAITLPSLMTDTTSAQIGPKLAKAVAMFEQANEAMLNAHSVDSLSDAGLLLGTLAYTAELGNYLKGHVADEEHGTSFLTKDGMLFTFIFNNANWGRHYSALAPHLQEVGEVTIDINGESRPNALGTDQFVFTLWNDGSLRPKGGVCWDGIDPGYYDDVAQNRLCEFNTGDGEGQHWKRQCPTAESGAVRNPEFCAGHIFENNFKVLYR